jgi:uncharacterized damage-inducible protein DinB
MTDRGGMPSNSGSGPGEGRPSEAQDEPVTRTFGWQDMFVRPEDDPRSDSGLGGERATLLGYLGGYRLTNELKCSGLDAAGLARRSVPPSNLSLLGLVRHLTDVERHWFRHVLDGQDVGWLYRRDHDRDAAFNGAVADPESVQAAWAAWREEVRFAERFVDAAPDLEVTSAYADRVISLREVLVHMIEEYARRTHRRTGGPVAASRWAERLLRHPAPVRNGPPLESTTLCGFRVGGHVWCPSSPPSTVESAIAGCAAHPPHGSTAACGLAAGRGPDHGLARGRGRGSCPLR